jgi:hypothetical protein
MQPAANGTDERLDAVLAALGAVAEELRGLRADLRGRPPPSGSPEAGTPAGEVLLREPRRRRGANPG